MMLSGAFPVSTQRLITESMSVTVGASPPPQWPMPGIMKRRTESAVSSGGISAMIAL
jgi:hypothetical protein